MTRRFPLLKQTLSEDVSWHQILLLSADFCCQQILFLSADFVSRFVFRQHMTLHLSTKQHSRWHIHFHASLFHEGNISPPAGAHFCCNHDRTYFAGPSRLHPRSLHGTDPYVQCIRCIQGMVYSLVVNASDVGTPLC
jgi:hypothetical protein